MSTAHHGDDKARIDAIMRRFVSQGERTARRAYPEGRLGADDEGELAFAVTVDKHQRNVVVAFNKPVSWMGMGPEDAVRLAQLLIDKARQLGAVVSIDL